MPKPYIIAEIGSSPAPDWNFPQWVTAAAAVGADAVKVQLFKGAHFPPDEVAEKTALEFPRDKIQTLATLARASGLGVGASVFDFEAVELAGIHLDFIKLAAREWNNPALTVNAKDIAARLRRPLYRSVPYIGGAAWQRNTPRSVLLYAYQAYPAPLIWSLFNLMRFALYADGEHISWGWSSHTRSTLDCELAAQLGARVIEKHLAISKTDLEAGHSLLPPQFKEMVIKCQSL